MLLSTFVNQEKEVQGWMLETKHVALCFTFHGMSFFWVYFDFLFLYFSFIFFSFPPPSLSLLWVSIPIPTPLWLWVGNQPLNFWECLKKHTNTIYFDREQIPFILLRSKVYKRTVLIWKKSYLDKFEWNAKSNETILTKTYFVGWSLLASFSMVLVPWFLSERGPLIYQIFDL